MSSTTNTIFRASRPLFRQQAAPFASRGAFRPQFQSRFNGSKRWQSTAEGASQQQQGWFKRMWESEVGFKTVHFW
jgi:hypothetical protein